jgi:hypothetical protein
MSTTLNHTIEFEGSDYSLFAVAYANGTYFMARIRLLNDVYEYDGMYMKGEPNLRLEDSKSLRLGKKILMQKMFEIKRTNGVHEFKIDIEHVIKELIIRNIELIIKHVIKEDSGHR